MASQTCEYGCGSDIGCDDLLPGFDSGGSKYCSDNCDYSECNYANRCDEVSDRTCTYSSGWKWTTGTTAPRVFGYDGGWRVCQGGSERTTGTNCQVKVDSAGGPSVRWVDGQWRETKAESYVFEDSSGNTIVCKGGTADGMESCGSEADICRSVTADDNNTYSCLVDSGGYDWAVVPADVYYITGETNQYLCSDAGERFECTVGNCDNNQVGSTNYICSLDRDDNPGWFEGVADGYAEEDNDFLCECNQYRCEARTCDEEYIATLLCDNYQIGSERYFCVYNYGETPTFKSGPEMNYGPFYDGDYSDPDKKGYICTGAVPVLCNSLNGCKNYEAATSASDGEYTCAYTDGWRWEGGFGVDYFLSDDDVGYLCDGNGQKEVCGTTSNLCRFVDIGSNFFTCFANSNKGFWIRGAAIADSSEDPVDILSNPALCPKTAGSYVECEQNYICRLELTRETASTDRFYFCVAMDWKTASELDGNYYYPGLSGPYGLGDEIVCTEDVYVSGACAEPGKTGAYCQPPGGTFPYEEMSDVGEGCTAALGAKDYVCTDGAWVNNFDPDNFRAQCPLPTAVDPANWADRGPPFLANSETLVLEGSCYDEGPSAAAISVRSYDASSLVFDLSEGVRGGTAACRADFSGSNAPIICGGDQEVGSAVKISASEFLLDLIGARININSGNIEKIPDHLECTSAVSTPTDCNVDITPGITVSAPCYDGNRVNVGDHVDLTINNRKYRYDCEEAGFRQVPVIYMDGASRSVVPLDPLTSSFTKGFVQYYIESTGTFAPDYHVFYAPRYNVTPPRYWFPLNIGENEYYVACNLYNGGSIVASVSPELLDSIMDFRNGVVSVGTVSKEELVSRLFKLECSVQGNANELGGSKSWTYSIEFEVDDQNVGCRQNSDCFGVCILPPGAETGICSGEVDCSDETTWEPTAFGASMTANETYTGLCRACGGYWVIDQIDLNKSFFVQTNFNEISYYNKVSRNPNGHVECSGGSCTYSGTTIFDVEADNHFTIDEMDWTISGSTVTFTPVSQYGACPDDPKDACSRTDGRKVVDIEVTSSDPLQVNVYSAKYGFCVGNQNNEERACTLALETFGGTDQESTVLEVVESSTSLGGEFSISYLDLYGTLVADGIQVDCLFPLDAGAASCTKQFEGQITSLDSSRVRVITGSGITDRFDISVPFGASYRKVRISCAHATHECHANSESAILELFPNEDIETFANGVRVNKLIGDRWRCINDGSSYFWVPLTTIDVKSYEMRIPAQPLPLYDDVGLTLEFKMPDWPKTANGISYSFSNIECSALGGELEQTYPVVEICDGSSICTFNSDDLDRSVIVGSCITAGSGPNSCIIDSACSGRIHVKKGGETKTRDRSDFVSTNLLYDDVGQSCYSSDDCLGTCNITEEYVDEGSSVYYSFENIAGGEAPGSCVAIAKSTSSQVCYAGNYIEDVLEYDEGFVLGDYPYKIACDEKKKGNSSCTYDCEYTCKWGVDRAYITMGGPRYSLSQGFPVDEYEGCDDGISGESYLNCMDCCEAPIASSTCNRDVDFISRFESGGVKYCGVKSFDAYDEDKTCYGSCGAAPECEGKRAGGTECTEWCRSRTSYEPEILLRDELNQTAELFSTCRMYTACFALPFDPYCGDTGCTLRFDSSPTGSYPVIIGSTRYGRNANSEVKFYRSDTRYDSTRRAWLVCTAGGKPMRIVPSESELGVIGPDTTLAVVYNFRLFSEGGSPYDYRYDSGYFTTSGPVAQPKADCDLADACMATSDCGNYPPSAGDPVNDNPLCSGYRCADPDAVGVFFSTVLAQNYNNLVDMQSSVWDGCSLGSCQYTLESCKAYFLGLKVTSDTFSVGGISDVSNVSVMIGDAFGNYRLDTTITAAGKHIPLSGSGIITIPGSIIDSEAYIFATLKDSFGAEVTSLAKLNFVQPPAQCSSADLLPSGPLDPNVIKTFDGDNMACYYNSSCLTHGANADPTANGDYGEVSSCLGIKTSHGVNLNNYPGTSYKFGRLCVNTCGNDICTPDVNELPTNCKDCCSDYGTGLVGQDYTTCYQHCDAPAQCDGVPVGTVVDGGVCGIRTGLCNYITDYTEIEEVTMSPGTSVINGSCYGEVPEIFCDFWINYTDAPSISFDLDEGMWSSIQDLPLEFSKLKNVSVSLEGGTKKEFGVGILPDAVVTLPVNLGRTYGPRVLKYTVRQKNRRGTTVTINLHTMYRSSLALSRITNRGCFYRAGSGDICEIPPVSLAVILEANSLEGPSSVNAQCSVDSISKTVALEYNDQLSQTYGRYAADGIFTFSPADMKVGRHTVTCTSISPYFYKAAKSLSVSIFGQLKAVEASVPSELIPGSTYSLFLSKVGDERGQVVPFYTYSWELKQGDISVPFGQTDIIEVPHNFVEGGAELVLKVDADYYDDLEKSYPVTINIPQQISASISPGIIYVPLAGSQSLRAKLLLSNAGPTVNVTVDYTAPKELLVTLPLTVVNVEGFNIDEVPVTIAVPQKTADVDYTVTFKAYVSGKLQDQVSLRIVQTQQPVYEFDVYPLEQELDLIYDEVKGNITLTNVGNMKDAYVVNTDMDVSDYEAVLEPAASKEITISARRPGEYQICIRSVRLLDREPRCVKATVARKEVTPTISGSDKEITLDPSRGASLLFNLTTAEYSGTYIIDFDTNLTMVPYERSFKAGTETIISVPFTTKRSGSYLVKATAYPKKYPDKSDSATVWVYVELPAPYEINALLEAIEASGVTDIDVLRSVSLAKRLVEEGNFEEARSILEEVSQQIERLEKIQSYKTAAKLMNPSRSYTFALVGVVLIAVGVILYIK